MMIGFAMGNVLYGIKKLVNKKIVEYQKKIM